MNAHLNQDELLELIYGARSEDGHLRSCRECAERAEALLRTKTHLRDEAETRLQVSTAFLAAQRRAVYARLDRAAALHVRWVPALAAAGLLAVGLLLFPHGEAGAPRTSVPEAQLEMSPDEQLLSDLYSQEQSLEPSGGAPLHQLFDSSAGSSEQ